MKPKRGLLLLSSVRHQRSYAPLFQKRPDVEIVGLADAADLPNWMREANESFATQFDVPYFTDIDAALGRRDVEIVSICSEPTRHAALTLKSIRAGKHVWVDKPIATRLNDADEIVEAVDKAGITLTYVHRLLSPTIAAARRAVDRGDIGLPYGLDITYLSAGGLTSGAVEDFQLVVDTSLSGGGELMNFLGYPVDEARYLTGLEVREVYISAGNYFFEPHREHGVEDFGVAFLKMDRGVNVTTTVGRTQTPNHPTGGDYTLRIHGSAGSLYSDENKPVLNVFSNNVTSRSRMTRSAGESMMEPLVDEFLKCIEEGRQPTRTARDGRALIAVIEAAYRSMSTGNVEPVEP
ncbi:MAG: Gfo/Idh/MocA family oxidoreductase [Nitrolancea sp.]